MEKVFWCFLEHIMYNDARKTQMHLPSLQCELSEALIRNS